MHLFEFLAWPTYKDNYVCTVIFCHEANNVFFILLNDSFCFVSFFNVNEKFLGYIFCDKN